MKVQFQCVFVSLSIFLEDCYSALPRASLAYIALYPTHPLLILNMDHCQVVHTTLSNCHYSNAHDTR